MKKFICILLISGPFILFGQDDLLRQHLTTTYPSVGRYEIVSSSLTRANTFKLDRYSGKVFQKVTTGSEDFDLVWEEVTVNGHPENTQKLTIYDAPSYQLFLSGRTNKDIFLLDTKKGYTWNLSRDTVDNVLFFYPIVSEEYFEKNIVSFVKNDSEKPTNYIKKIIPEWNIQMYEDEAMRRISMEIKKGDEVFILKTGESTFYVWSDGMKGYIKKN